MVMISHRKGGRLSWREGANPSPNIVRMSAPSGQFRLHPNEKPLKFVQHFVSLHTEVGQSVLDPFMGSGTTGVACAKMGRKFIGIELDEGFFDITCRRIEDAYKQADLFIKQEPNRPEAEQTSISF